MIFCLYFVILYPIYYYLGTKELSKGTYNMLFIKLKKQYFNLFSDLDPYSMLDNDLSNGRFVMGLWGKHEGYDYPVGLAICTETPDSLIINWMMVSNLFRAQGLGSYMLKKLIKLAKEFNKTKVQAAFYRRRKESLRPSSPRRGR